MKITLTKFLLASVFSLLLLSCHKDAVRGKVGFTTTDATGAESVGEQTVTISLGETVSTDTKIVFSVGGTASLNGDYSLESTSPITVSAGKSEFTFKFKVIDDAIIENTDETVVFTITSVDNYTTKTTDNLVYTFTIKDNDTTPASAMQADLTWDLGEGIDINLVDMDLVILKDVVLDSEGNITDGTQINPVVTSGFESFQFTSALADGDYYIIVDYYSGTSDVPILLGLNDAVNGYRKLTYDFPSGHAGYYVYTMTTKTGNTYTRSSSQYTTAIKLSPAFASKLARRG